MAQDIPDARWRPGADRRGRRPRRRRVAPDPPGANHDLGPLGVTWAQVRALRTVARCGGPVRMSELADRLGIARRSATSVVDELVERGLVGRPPTRPTAGPSRST